MAQESSALIPEAARQGDPIGIATADKAESPAPASIAENAAEIQTKAAVIVAD